MIRRRSATNAGAAPLIGLLGAISAPAVAQGLGGGRDLDISLGRIVAALVICLIITVLAILLIRQRSGKVDLRALLSRFETGQRTIEVVETRRLSPHADICAVRHGGREYLILLLAGRAEILSQSAIQPPFDARDDAACD